MERNKELIKLISLGVIISNLPFEIKTFSVE